MGEQRKSLILLLILSLFLPAFSLPLVSAAEDSWTTMEPMPTARSGLGVAVVDGKIYAIGGFVGTNTPLGTNEMYDPETDTWTTKTSMPTPRAYFAIAAYQNKIYVIGGLVALLVNTGINEVYDTLTDTWETKNGIPDDFGRDGFCANVVNDKIYLISGSATPLPPYHNSDKNYAYDPLNDSWTTKAPIPTPVYGYASAVIDNKIYAIGGRDIPSNTIYNLTQIYEPETDTWSYGAPMPAAVHVIAAGATSGVCAPKRIYIPHKETHYVYDPETDEWTTANPMITPRSGVGIAVVNDVLYAIGGKTEEGDNFSAANEKYTPAEYIPEFPSWVILPLFFVATLVGVAVRRKVFRPT